MKVLSIGSRSNIERNYFTGQSIMFDGINDELAKQNHNVTIIDITPKGKNKTISRIIEYLLVLLKEIWYLTTKKFDISYLTTAQSKKGFIRDYMIIRILSLFKVKVIIHQYGANYNQLLNSLGKKGRKLLNKMLHRVNLIIVEGEHMRNQFSFLNNYETKVQIIPNGLPSLGEHALRVKSYEKKEPFRIFYLSNLIWSKGYFDVLEAVNLLVNKYHKNVNCVFAGAFMDSVDDPQPGISNKKDFDKYISDNRLETIITYYPGLYGKEKDQMFDKSNVFILPTYYINEGQPVSIIEAMAYGCVPIVTNFRHIPMMINDRNGCFVHPNSPDQIAKAIIMLMDNNEKYKMMSTSCIQDYQNNFTFDKFANKVLESLKKVANTH